MNANGGRVCRTWTVLAHVAEPIIGAVSARTLRRIHATHGLPIVGGGRGRPVRAERQLFEQRLRELAPRL